MNTQQHTQQQQKPVKAPPKPITHDNPLETFRDMGSDVVSSLKNDFFKNSTSNALDSLFGGPKSGDIAKNPFEFPFGKSIPKETPEQVRNRELLSPQRISQEQAMVKQQIDTIRQELAMLAKELGTLNQEVQKAIMEVPVDPGTYHLNFFERLRSIIQLLRKSVRDSNTWLQVGSSRKKQQGYWAKYKKHGTQFGLSADRTPQTQTG